jgi:3-phosphoglycerate kinase
LIFRFSSHGHQTVKDIDVSGKRVFVRVDFNVPVDPNGTITDETRIVGALPTIQYLVQNKAKVVLASHLGRPKGVTPEFTLRPVAAKLAEKLGQPVTFVEDCVGEKAESAVADMQPGQVVLLENVSLLQGTRRRTTPSSQEARQAGRRVCERRLWHGAPRPRIDGRHRRVRRRDPQGLGLPHRKGAGVPRRL